MKNLMEKINDPLERQEIYADYCDFLEAIEGFKINISEKTKNDTKNINCLLFKEFININEKLII